MCDILLAFAAVFTAPDEVALRCWANLPLAAAVFRNAKVGRSLGIFTQQTRPVFGDIGDIRMYPRLAACRIKAGQRQWSHLQGKQKAQNAMPVAAALKTDALL